MLVYEHVYEETYGGRHVYHMSVEEFDGQNMHIGATEDGKIVIDEHAPGTVCHRNYTVIHSSKNEITRLQRSAIQNMETRIAELEESIEDIIQKYPICLKEIEVSFHMQVGETDARIYECPAMNGIVTMKTTLLQLILNGYIHPNTEYSTRFGPGDYWILHGRFSIPDKEVNNFTKKMVKSFSFARELKWIKDSYDKKRAYERNLKWSQNVTPRDL